MGYMLSSLGALPVDEKTSFYIFVINGRWREPLYDVIEQNFNCIARNIGRSAVVAKGFDPVEWSVDVAKVYLGSDYKDYSALLPALLITDAHPSQVTKKSLRLVVPLGDVENRFGGWSRFFALLADFVQFKGDEFIKCFDSKKNAFDLVNKVVSVRPGAFGIAINVNEIVSWWRDRKSTSRG